MNNQIIANNLKELRKAYKITQFELAEIAGVSNQSVSSWEKGITTPRNKSLSRIADHYHFPINIFYVEDGFIRYMSFDPVGEFDFGIELGKRLKNMADKMQQISYHNGFARKEFLLLILRENYPPEAPYKFLKRSESYADFYCRLFDCYYSLPESQKDSFFELIAQFVNGFDSAILDAFETFSSNNKGNNE